MAEITFQEGRRCWDLEILGASQSTWPGTIQEEMWLLVFTSKPRREGLSTKLNLNRGWDIIRLDWLNQPWLGWKHHLILSTSATSTVCLPLTDTLSLPQYCWSWSTRLPSLTMFLETALNIYTQSIPREAPLKTSLTQQVFPMGQGRTEKSWQALKSNHGHHLQEENHFLFTLSNQNTLEAGRHSRLVWLLEILPQKRQNQEEQSSGAACLYAGALASISSPHTSLGCSASTGEVEAERSKFKVILSQTVSLSPAWSTWEVLSQPWLHSSTRTQK